MRWNECSWNLYQVTKAFYTLARLSSLPFSAYIFTRCSNILKNHNDVCKVVSVNNDESLGLFGTFHSLTQQVGSKIPRKETSIQTTHLRRSVQYCSLFSRRGRKRWHPIDARYFGSIQACIQNTAHRNINALLETLKFSVSIITIAYKRSREHASLA